MILFRVSSSAGRQAGMRTIRTGETPVPSLPIPFSAMTTVTSPHRRRVEKRRTRQQGTSPMNPKRKLPGKWRAGVVGLFVLLFALFLACDNQPVLSPMETQLVGEWSANPQSDTRTFLPDRTFTTSSGQFSGVWRINAGRLTVTYWVPIEITNAYDIQSTFNSIRRSRKTYTCTWEIELTDNGQQHNLSHPIDELHPDGKWFWTRVPGS